MQTKKWIKNFFTKNLNTNVCNEGDTNEQTDEVVAQCNVPDELIRETESQPIEADELKVEAVAQCYDPDELIRETESQPIEADELKVEAVAQCYDPDELILETESRPIEAGSQMIEAASECNEPDKLKAEEKKKSTKSKINFHLPDDFSNEPPRTIPEKLIPVLPFDYDMLPESLKDFVKDSAERMDNCCPDFIAVSIMVLIAAIVGSRVAIQPKQFDDVWNEVPTLWGAIVAPPSGKKTPAISTAFSLLDSIQEEFDETYKNDLFNYEFEKKISALEGKSTGKKSDAAFLKGEITKDELKQIMKDNQELENSPPSHRNVIISDTTVEALVIRLSNNPHGIVMVRDELTGWLSDMSREENASARAFYLGGFSASKIKFAQDRVSRENIELKRIVLSMLGGIQPAMLIPFLLKRQTGTLNDGLFERLQVSIYPDNDDITYIDKKADIKARESAIDVIKKIASIPANENGEPLMFKFEHDAQQLFISRYKSTITAILSANKAQDDGLGSILGKECTLVAKLSLLLHLASEPENQTVSVKALKQALLWGDYLRSHSQRIHALIESNNTSAYVLLEKLPVLPNPFTASSFRTKGWSSLTTKHEREQALSTLVEHGYLFKHKVFSTKGRPRDDYYKHPSIVLQAETVV
jgi:hypothetical protein